MSRVAVILLSTSTMTALACSSSVAPGDDARDIVPFETLFQSDRFFAIVVEPVYVVLRSEAEEAHFLDSYPRDTSYTSSGEPRVPPFPTVHYEHKIVVGVALGRRGVGNTVVTVDSLVSEENKLIVYTSEHDPCFEEPYFSNPSHFIETARRDLEVTFAPTPVVEVPCR